MINILEVIGSCIMKPGTCEIWQGVESIDNDDEMKSEILSLMRTCKQSDKDCQQKLYDKLEMLNCEWENPTADLSETGFNVWAARSEMMGDWLSFDTTTNALQKVNDPTIKSPYGPRGNLKCLAPEHSLFWAIVCVCLATFVLASWFFGTCVIAKRSPLDVMGGVAKLPKNMKRTNPLKLLYEYQVADDDLAFFAKTIPQLPHPDEAVTNVTKYMAWRRRALYALFPMVFIMFIETVYTSWPEYSNLSHLHDCHAGDSLQKCGGTGQLYQFLSAGGMSAPGIQIYHLLMVTSKIAIAAYACVAVRLGSVRSGEWERSRNWLFLSWIVPFAFSYFQFMFPLESLFWIDYEARRDQAVMMPAFSSDVHSKTFSFCVAMHTCAQLMPFATLSSPKCALCQEITRMNCREPTVLANQPYWQANGFANEQACVDARAEPLYHMPSNAVPPDYKYASQDSAGELDVWIGDSGEFYVKEMVDVLDALMHFAFQTDTGEISETASNLLGSLEDFLRGMVRAKTSLATLSTLAPLALSLLPALQKASYAVKQVFPQDAFVGWIVRAVPLLAVPLHAVFIMLIGQIFSDWFVCVACICLLIGMSAVTIWFREGTKPFDNAEDIVTDYKKAKKKGLAFNLIAVLSIAVAIASNDLISKSMPEISLRPPEGLGLSNVLGFLHFGLVFIANFFISKLQITIIGADFMMQLVFTLVEHLNDANMQKSYQEEVLHVKDGIKRVWQEGDPPPSGFIYDLFGGVGDFDFLHLAKMVDFNGARVQLNGQGAMLDAEISLADSDLTIKTADQSITVSVVECRLALPKKPRPGYPNTFRLDTKEVDKVSHLSKFIFTFADPAAMDEWMAKLKAHQSQESADNYSTLEAGLQEQREKRAAKEEKALAKEAKRAAEGEQDPTSTFKNPMQDLD